MCPMIVWRFEDKEGKGPFRGYQLGMDLDATILTPDPETDFHGTIWDTPSHLVFIPSEWYFGFYSKTQAAYHFPAGDREIMGLKGIFLHTFLVPPGAFVIGHHQVAFKREAAIKIS